MDPTGERPCDQIDCALDEAGYSQPYSCLGTTSFTSRDSVLPLFYDCAIYSLRRESILFVDPYPLAFATWSGVQQEPSPVYLGSVAAKGGTWGGYSPEWTTQASLIAYHHTTGAFEFNYEPYKGRAMSGAIAVVELINLIGAEKVVYAESNTYRWFVQPLNMIEIPPVRARAFHEGESLVYAQKEVEGGTCWIQTEVFFGASPRKTWGDGPRQDCAELRLPS